MSALRERRATPATLILNPAAYAWLCERSGAHSDRLAADLLGYERSAASRVRGGVQAPGIAFIAGALRAWGDGIFHDYRTPHGALFTVAADPAPHRRRSAA